MSDDSTANDAAHPTPAERRRQGESERGRHAQEVHRVRVRSRIARELDDELAAKGVELTPDEREQRIADRIFAEDSERAKRGAQVRVGKAQPEGGNDDETEAPLADELDRHAFRATALAILGTMPARRAIAARNIGRVFGLLNEAGILQTRIARQTGCSQSEVSEIIVGSRTVHSYDLLARIADGLGVPRGWMGLAHTDAAGVATAYGDGGEADTTEDDDMRRRQLLSTATFALFGQVVASEKWSSSGAAGAIRFNDQPHPMLMDTDTVNAMTAQWRALDHEHGGLAIHQAVSESAQRVSHALRTSSQEPERDLLVAVAHQHSLAGATAADAGAPDLARWHFDVALDLAGQADDLRTIAWVLDDAGRMELARGEHAEALALFQLAGSRLQPWPVLHALIATCYADLVRHDDMRRHLRQANDSGPTSVGTDGQTAHALRMSGDWQGAVAHYERSLAGRADDPGDARARCVEHAGIATAQLRAGNIAAGTESAARSLELVSSLRSTYARASLQPLYRAAIERNDSTCQDIAQQVRVAATAVA